MIITVILQLGFFLLAAFVLHSITLKQEQDMNMKEFVVKYLVFWGLTRMMRMMLAFAIE